MIGTVAVIFCLTIGCQDNQKASPQPKSAPISIKSEKVKQDERQEFERCLKAAELGDAVEQYDLGNMYLNPFSSLADSIS